jgi:hypothetical protein
MEPQYGNTTNFAQKSTQSMVAIRDCSGARKETVLRDYNDDLSVQRH